MAGKLIGGLFQRNQQTGNRKRLPEPLPQDHRLCAKSRISTVTVEFRQGSCIPDCSSESGGSHESVI